MSLSLAKKALAMFDDDQMTNKPKNIKPAKKKKKVAVESSDKKIKKLLLMSGSVIDSKMSRKVSGMFLLLNQEPC